MVPTVSSLLIPVDYFSRNGASPQSFNRGDQFLFRFNFMAFWVDFFALDLDSPKFNSENQQSRI